jgi:hypothetical protein
MIIMMMMMTMPVSRVTNSTNDRTANNITFNNDVDDSDDVVSMVMVPRICWTNIRMPRHDDDDDDEDDNDSNSGGGDVTCCS